MPWVYYKGEEYHLSLTDGYVTIPEAGRRKLPQEEGESDEQWLARKLYRLATHADEPPRRQLFPPNMFHVWVIGSDRIDWMANPPALIGTIADDECNSSSYKIFIDGIDAASYKPRPIDPDFPDAVVLDGMIRAGILVIQAFLAILTGAPDG